MKKTLFNITLALATVLVAASCDKNLPKAFSDANAFVAFDKATATVAEAVIKEDGTFAPNEKTIKIGVTLGSVSGLTANVPFEIVDGTAKKGVNYEIVGGSNTLAFDASHRTQYIEVKGLFLDKYTGDLKFTIKLQKANGVNLGAASECVVTVSDVNHPMTPILGDYAASSATDSMMGDWTLSIYKDDNDDHVVWLFNFCCWYSGWYDFDTMYYGVVNEDADGNLVSISVPFGQATEYKYGGSHTIELYWLADDGSIGKDGPAAELMILKDADGKVTGLDFGDWGFTAQVDGYIDLTNYDEGCLAYAFAPITAVKQ